MKDQKNLHEQCDITLSCVGLIDRSLNLHVIFEGGEYIQKD